MNKLENKERVMDMSNVYSSLFLKGMVQGVKRSEQYGDSLQFMIREGDQIAQADVRLHENDRQQYKIGDVVSVAVRAFGRKTGGVGYQAVDKAIISEQK